MASSSLRVRPVDYHKKLVVITGTEAAKIAPLSSSVPLCASSLLGIEKDELTEIHLDSLIKAEEHGQSSSQELAIPIPSLSIVSPPERTLSFHQPLTYIHHDYTFTHTITYDLDDEDAAYLSKLATLSDIVITFDDFEKSMEALEFSYLENPNISHAQQEEIISNILPKSLGFYDFIIDYWKEKRISRDNYLFPCMRPPPAVSDTSPLIPFRKISENDRKKRRKYSSIHSKYLRLVSLLKQLSWLQKVVSLQMEKSLEVLRLEETVFENFIKRIDRVSPNIQSCFNLVVLIKKLSQLPLISESCHSLLASCENFQLPLPLTTDSIGKLILSKISQPNFKAKEDPIWSIFRKNRLFSQSLCSFACITQLFNPSKKLLVHCTNVNGSVVRKVCYFNYISLKNPTERLNLLKCISNKIM
ncbi:hypothetical protein P9112_005808 [Eukaryota sp. TZLM1-RC]